MSLSTARAPASCGSTALTPCRRAATPNPPRPPHVPPPAPPQARGPMACTPPPAVAPAPTSVRVNGGAIPAQRGQAQVKSWILGCPGQYDQAFVNGPAGRIAQFGRAPSTAPVSGTAQIRRVVDRDIATIYGDYILQEN